QCVERGSVFWWRLENAGWHLAQLGSAENPISSVEYPAGPAETRGASSEPPTRLRTVWHSISARLATELAGSVSQPQAHSVAHRQAVHTGNLAGRLAEVYSQTAHWAVETERGRRRPL